MDLEELQLWALAWNLFGVTGGLIGPILFIGFAYTSWLEQKRIIRDIEDSWRIMMDPPRAPWEDAKNELCPPSSLRSASGKSK
jgi:hypothetical protein